MSFNVNSVGAYSPNFQGNRIDPRNDKAYIDPRTGERTTWKPGIFDPEAQQRNADSRLKVSTALLGVTGLAAAVVFRKPIGKFVANAATKVVKYAKPLLTKGAEYATKAFGFVKGHAQTAIAKVIKFFGKSVV